MFIAPPLADITSLLFQSVQIYEFATEKWYPMESSKSVVCTWYYYHWSIFIYIHVLGCVVDYWPIVGTCGCHNHSKLCHSCCSVSFLWLLPPPTLSLPSQPPPCLYLYWPKIDVILIKNFKETSKINHYLIYQVIGDCVKAIR